MKLLVGIAAILSAAITLAAAAFGCDQSFSCTGKDVGDMCVFNGNAGFCESTEGYCLLACAGPRGDCTGAGSGAACYWMDRDKYVCRGAGDSRSAGALCSGKITDCGTRNWCVPTPESGPRCATACRDDIDCSDRLGVTCRDIVDGGGMTVCVPLIP